MSDELIQIGVDPKVKLTILQLWTMYLSKLEVAFTSKTKKCVPKMARRYHKKYIMCCRKIYYFIKIIEY